MAVKRLTFLPLTAPASSTNGFPTPSVERRLPEAVLGKLREKGHKIQAVDSIGVPQIDGKSGYEFSGASDPRVMGKAAEW